MTIGVLWWVADSAGRIRDLGTRIYPDMRVGHRAASPELFCFDQAPARSREESV